MTLLYLLADGREPVCDRLIALHSRQHDVTVIDLSKRDVSYERIVEAICAHDRVVSW
jgi:hypothetical protein